MNIKKDFPDIYSEYKENGIIVLGFIKIKCPTYCLHLDYIAELKDPFFAYDKSICLCYKRKPSANGVFISRILGLGWEFFESRRKYLVDNGFISENDEKFNVTELGIRHYINENEFQIEVESHIDLFIDGRTFEIWNAEQRSNILWKKGEKADFPFTPISGGSDEIFEEILEDLNDDDEEFRRQALGISTRAKDFKYSSHMFDTCTISRWLLVYKKNNTPGVALSPMDDFGEESLGNLNAITFFISKEGTVFLSKDVDHTTEDESYSYIEFHYQNKEQAKQAFVRKLEKYFGMSEEVHLANAPISDIPIRISISEQALRNARGKENLIATLKTGYHPIYTKDDSILLIPFVPASQAVKNLIEFDSKISEMIDNNATITVDYLMSERGTKWRMDLITLGRYELLETIDIANFIKA